MMMQLSVKCKHYFTALFQLYFPPQTTNISPLITIKQRTFFVTLIACSLCFLGLIIPSDQPYAKFKAFYLMGKWHDVSSVSDLVPELVINKQRNCSNFFPMFRLLLRVCQTKEKLNCLGYIQNTQSIFPPTRHSVSRV